MLWLALLAFIATLAAMGWMVLSHLGGEPGGAILLLWPLAIGGPVTLLFLAGWAFGW